MSFYRDAFAQGSARAAGLGTLDQQREDALKRLAQLQSGMSPG